MILRMSVLVLLGCAGAFSQTASADAAQKGFPPEVSLANRKDSSLQTRRLCADRQPQAGTVSFRACPAPPPMRLVKPLGNLIPMEVPEQR